MRQRRLVASALACESALLVLAGPAAAKRPTYLALGDSVTFGYQAPQLVPPPDYSRASTFRGYPEHVGAALHLTVVNAACPGETSVSLVNANGPSNGCENSAANPTVGYRKLYPLHVRYSRSQLSFAASYLHKHPRTRVVSLMIGANDLFRCQTTTSDRCVSEFQGTLAAIRKNVRTILSTIRRKAHYRGRVVVVKYYSTDYTEAFLSGATRLLDDSVVAAAKPFRVAVADGYGQFQAASRQSGDKPCQAGLLGQLSSGACDVHPSFAGQGLLALAVERAIR